MPRRPGRATTPQNVGMGAWGPGLFSDDLARDVRADYRELIQDGVTDEDATRRIVERYLAEPADPDEDPVVWLALAFTQSKLGRLDPAVRDRAVAVIDSGANLASWTENPQQRAKRRAVLEKVRAQLVGPQPARRKLRRPSRHVTDLHVGEVLAYRGVNDRLALVRVARIDDDLRAPLQRGRAALQLEVHQNRPRRTPQTPRYT
jgi:hypothetical protein